MARWRHLISGAGWLVGCVGATWALVALGRLSWFGIDWSDPLGWLSSTQPELAVAEISRLAGLGAIGWIVLSTVVYVGAVLWGVDPRRLRWMSVGPIRRIVDALVAGTLVIGTLAPGAAIAQTESTLPPVTETTVAHRTIAPDYVPAPAGLGGDAAAKDTPDEGNVPRFGSTSEPTTTVVEPGDNLWDLSRERLVASGFEPTDAQVADYWVQVIDVNRSRLRSGDPDLIYPGEEIVLPSLSSES